MAYKEEGHLLMSFADRKNPFHTELSEALRLYRLIKELPGENAKSARDELQKTIKELRAWPDKLKQHDADRMIAIMKSELEVSKELSRTLMEAYEKIEREVTEQTHHELNP